MIYYCTTPYSILSYSLFRKWWCTTLWKGSQPSKRWTCPTLTRSSWSSPVWSLKWSQRKLLKSWLHWMWVFLSLLGCYGKVLWMWLVSPTLLEKEIFQSISPFPSYLTLPISWFVLQSGTWRFRVLYWSVLSVLSHMFWQHFLSLFVWLLWTLTGFSEIDSLMTSFDEEPSSQS